MEQGSQHFEGRGEVQAALRKIARRLDEIRVPYAIAGGMALFRHGLRRFTEDVDILVTRDGLTTIHERLAGLGYVLPFAQSKNLRDAENGVRIEFLVAGAFPGDGNPKPVAFPDPALVSVDLDGIRYLSLPALIELKIASGLTGAGRMKDLADAMELIKALELRESFADQLHPYVRPKYAELWRSSRRRYVRAVPRAVLAAAEQPDDDMPADLRPAVRAVKMMLADGAKAEPAGTPDGSSALLVTTDPAVARKHDMHDESEVWLQRGTDSPRPLGG